MISSLYSLSVLQTLSSFPNVHSLRCSSSAESDASRRDETRFPNHTPRLRLFVSKITSRLFLVVPPSGCYLYKSETEHVGFYFLTFFRMALMLGILGKLEHNRKECGG